MSISGDRRRARKYIRGRLALPTGPLTLQHLIDAVARSRGGKPIEVVRRRLAPRVTGFCAVLEDRDVIVVDATAPRFLQLVITCHELFHLLHDDEPADDCPIDMETARALMPGIGQDMVRLVLLGRCLDGAEVLDQVEHFAEVGGTVLMQMIDLSPDDAATGAYTSALENRRPGV
jgi:hypothetical protein